MVEITGRTVFIAGGTSGIGHGLAPPAVATPAMAKLNPAGVPLDEYLDEVMDLMKEQPTPCEIVVKAAQPLRWAERDGTYADLR